MLDEGLGLAGLSREVIGNGLIGRDRDLPGGLE